MAGVNEGNGVEVDLNEQVFSPVGQSREIIDPIISSEGLVDAVEAESAAPEVAKSTLEKKRANFDADSFEESIRGSDDFVSLSSALDDQQVSIEEKLRRISGFIDSLRQRARNEGADASSINSIPLVAELIRRDVELAGEFQREHEKAESEKSALNSAQEKLKNALAVVHTSEWIGRGAQERINFLRDSIEEVRNELSGSSVKIDNLQEFENLNGFIHSLERVALQEKKDKDSLDSKKSKKVGILGGIKGWFVDRRVQKIRRLQEEELERKYFVLADKIANTDSSLQEQVDALQEFIEEARRTANGAEWVENIRTVLDAKAAIEGRLSQISADTMEQKENSSVSKAGGADDRSEWLNDEDLLNGKYARSKTDTVESSVEVPAVHAQEGSPSEPSAPEFDASPAVESVNIRTADEAETPQGMEDESEEADAEQNNQDSIENQAEVFAVGLRNAFRKLQESRMVGGKVEKITSGEAYARFKKLLAEEIRITSAQPAIIKQVLQETFDKETRPAPRVILGMALRDLGVTVKMKDGELSKFKRVEK